MDGPEILRKVSPSDPHHDEIVELCLVLDRAAHNHLADHPDKVAAASLIMTAGAVLSGQMFGRLLIAGAANDKDRRRAAEGCARNFRTGIDIGRQAALRVATEIYGGNA